jgi:hypothetical protein
MASVSVRQMEGLAWELDVAFALPDGDFPTRARDVVIQSLEVSTLVQSRSATRWSIPQSACNTRSIPRPLFLRTNVLTKQDA